MWCWATVYNSNWILIPEYAWLTSCRVISGFHTSTISPSLVLDTISALASFPMLSSSFVETAKLHERVVFLWLKDVSQIYYLALDTVLHFSLWNLDTFFNFNCNGNKACTIKAELVRIACKYLNLSNILVIKYSYLLIIQLLM